MKSIDLHGVKHEDVRRKLDIFYWEVMQKNITQVEVITGVSKSMKDIVYEISGEYGFSVIENPKNWGSLFVNMD
jgi:hypothetical protein